MASEKTTVHDRAVGQPDRRNRAAAVGQPERRNRAAADALEAAIARRAPLLESGQTDAWRVLNGAADGPAGTEARPTEARLTEARPTEARSAEARPTEARPTEARPTEARPAEARPTEARTKPVETGLHGLVTEGLVIEKYADVLIAQLHEGQLAMSEAEVRALCELAMERLRATAVYRKRFIRGRTAGADESLDTEHTAAEPWLGPPAAEEFAVNENGMRLLVRPYDGFATGLYLDQRDNRRRIRDLAAGREVLNAFAYTCGFSLAAALGGAAATASVDVSRKHLEWGKRNFGANAVALDGHEFIAADVMDYLRRAARRDRRFDLIVLDPPSFGRARRPARTFVLGEVLEELVAAAWGRLRSGGVLLLSTNHRGIPRKRLEAAVAGASGGRHAVLERPKLPLDFAGDPDYAKSILVRRP